MPGGATLLRVQGLAGDRGDGRSERGIIPAIPHRSTTRTVRGTAISVESLGLTADNTG